MPTRVVNFGLVVAGECRHGLLRLGVIREEPGKGFGDGGVPLWHECVHVKAAVFAPLQENLTQKLRPQLVARTCQCWREAALVAKFKHRRRKKRVAGGLPEDRFAVVINRGQRW